MLYASARPDVPRPVGPLGLLAYGDRINTLFPHPGFFFIPFAVLQLSYLLSPSAVRYEFSSQF